MKKYWLYSINILDILNDPKLAITDKASQIIDKLSNNAVFKTKENRTVLSELAVAAQTSNTAFEDRLDALFNVADYNRVWLGP